MVQEPLPAPEPEPAASCQRWQLRAFPVNNDGSDFVLYSADRPGEQEGEGAAIRDGLKDVTLVRLCHTPCSATSARSLCPCAARVHSRRRGCGTSMWDPQARRGRRSADKVH